MKEPFPNDLRCSNFPLLKIGKIKVSAWQSWGTEEMPERQWRCAALREAATPEAAEPDMDQSRGLAQPEARDGAGKALWLHPHGSGEHTTSSCSPGEAHGICVPEDHRVGSSRLSGQGRHGHMAWAGRDRDTPGRGRERQGHPWHGQGHPWHGQGDTQTALAWTGTPLAQAGTPSPRTHLQDDGQLLGGVAVLHAHGQPHLEGRELLGEEGAVLGEQSGNAGMG